MRLLPLFLALLLFPLASSQITVSNGTSLGEIYSPGQALSGTLVFSLSDVPATTTIKVSSSSETISLQDLYLADNLSATCSPESCLSIFSAGARFPTKSYTLSSGETRDFGFVIDGPSIEGVSHLEFSLSSSAGSSCQNQLSLDFFSDNEDEWIVPAIGGSSCGFSRTYGCFSEGLSAEQILIDSDSAVCQRFTLPQAPGFSVGAWIKNKSGARQVTFQLYTAEGSPLSSGSCAPTLAGHTEGEVSCSLNVSTITSDDYYLCLLPGTQQGEFYIQGTSSAQCGFRGSPPRTETSAYRLFIEPRSFGSLSNEPIGNVLPLGNQLSALGQDYLFATYGFEPDCSGTSCVIPFTLRSHVGQTITLQGPLLRFLSQGNTIERQELADLTPTPARISTSETASVSFSSLPFFAPEEPGNHSVSVFIGDTLALEKNITVLSPPRIRSVGPQVVSAALPFTLVVSLADNVSIETYTWKFGENETVTTTVPELDYQFNKSQNRTVTITLKDGRGLETSETFLLRVLTAEAAIQSTLDRYKGGLETTQSFLNAQPGFAKSGLETTLGLETISEDLLRLQRRFESTANEEDYADILQELFSLRVPLSLYIEQEGSLQYYPQPEHLDFPTIAGQLGESETNPDQDRLLRAMQQWHAEYYTTQLSFTHYAGQFSNSIEPVLSSFTLQITEKEFSGVSPTLVIGPLENLTIGGAITLERPTETIAALTLTSDDPITLTFTTPEFVDFLSLPAVISPPFSELSVYLSGGQDVPPAPESDFPWGLYLGIFCIVVLLGFLFYLFLQAWYKYRYEKYLFSDRNELYNAAMFIRTSKSRNLSEGDIAQALHRNGWSGEQVTYALKKYSGKSTGMFELPIPLFDKLFAPKKQKNASPPPGALPLRRPPAGGLPPRRFPLR